MNRHCIPDTERIDWSEVDTAVDPLAGRIRHRVPRLAVGTGKYPVVPPPTVPEGAYARGKRRWLGVRIAAAVSGSEEPRFNRE